MRKPNTQSSAEFKNTADLKNLFHQGLAFHQNGQLHQAQSAYEKILSLQPNHFDALHLLGLIFYQNKNLIRALELVEKAIILNSDFPIALNNRGNILRDLNRLDEAVKSYDSAIRLKSDYAQAYNNRGNALSDMKRHEEAILSYERAIEINPNNPDSHFNHGNALKRINKLEEAIQSYDKVLALNAKDAEAFNNKGIAFLELKRHGEALQCFDSSLALLPKYADAHFNRGRALRELISSEMAAASFEACTQIETQNKKYLLLGGLNYLSIGKTSQAERFLNRCISSTPLNEEEIKIDAVAYLRLNNWKTAFDSCLEVLPSIPSYLHDRFGDSEKAKSYIRSLPDLYIIKSKDWAARRTIMFAADEVYIKKYFNKALSSANHSNPTLNVHLHAMLSSEEAADDLKLIANANLSISYEVYIPENKTGYTTRRFVRIYQLLPLLEEPILCLDIDSSIINNLDALFDKLSLADIGLYRRSTEPVINQLIAAGMFWACCKPGAFIFLEFFINYIQYLEVEQRMTWFADQMALLAADEWSSRRTHSVNVHQIPEETLSWLADNEKTLVHTFKGSLKN